MRASRLFASAAALTLVFSACGKGGGSTKTEAGQSPSAKKRRSATTNDINAVDRDKLPDGGILHWPIDSLPPNFNAQELDGTDANNAAVMGALLPSMFNFDAASQPTINADYLVSGELTAKDPKQVVTYKLNPKALWSDGTPITEADFEAQWKADNGTDKAYTSASSNGYEKIESVTKGADEREVVVTFREPYVDWKGLFSFLYPASTNRDPKVYNEGWIGKIPTTAGPFQLGGVDETAKTITLVRDERWWGKRAKLDKIVYLTVAPDVQVEALLNKEIDFFDIGPDVNKLTRAQSAAGVTIHKAGGPNFRHITINGTGPILKDVKVRRALAMAINRDQIAKVLLGPLGVDPEPLQNHIFMANQTGYQDNAGDLSSSDVGKARKLLDEAGWKLEGDVRKKDGKELSIRFVIPTNVNSSKQESDLVFNMLKKVNVKVVIDSVPTAEFFDKHIRPGDFDFTVFSWLGTPFPISASKSIYAQPKEGDDIQQNYARVGTPEINALFDKATSEFDERKALALGNEIDAGIWDEVHSLTLYQRPELVATKANLANLGAFGFASGHYEDFGFTK